MNSKGFCVLLAAALAVASQAQVTPEGKGFLFRVKYVQGRLYKYSLASTVIANQSTPIKIVAPYTIRVSKILNGMGLIDATLGPLMAGSDKVEDKQSFRYLETTLGIIPTTKTVPQMPVAFPKEPKRIGQTWDAQTSVKSAGSDSIVKAHYQFLGMTTYGGKRVAKLSMKLSSTGQTDTKGSGIVFILAEDGSLYGNKVSLTVSLPNSGKMASTGTLTRIQ